MDFPFISIACLLLVSAIFSSSETSFFSLSKVQFKQIGKKNPKSFKRIKYLLDRPTTLIATLLIGNESANVLISNILANYYNKHLDSWWSITIINICTALPLIIIIGEITPRVIAAKANIHAVTFLSPAVWFLYRISYPIRIFIEYVVNFFAKITGMKYSRDLTINEDDLLEAVTESKEKGAIRESEQELIENVLDLDDETVFNLCVPVNEFPVVVQEKERVMDIIPKILEHKLSRTPVIGDFPNQVVGVLYTKDLLRYSHRPEENLRVKQLMKEPFFVNINMKIDNLFRRMRQLRTHIIFATDKDDNVAGVITMEDVLGEIFSEFWEVKRGKHV